MKILFKIFICRHCKKEFNYKNGLINHIFKKHGITCLRKKNYYIVKRAEKINYKTSPLREKRDPWEHYFQTEFYFAKQIGNTGYHSGNRHRIRQLRSQTKLIEILQPILIEEK